MRRLVKGKPRPASDVPDPRVIIARAETRLVELARSTGVFKPVAK